MPKLSLNDLLKRRKNTLSVFIREFGIATYQHLVERCDRMGVSPPSIEEFDLVKPQNISSPSEGIVVLEPPPVIQESTGNRIPDSEIDEPSDFIKKKYKKKKETDLNE